MITLTRALKYTFDDEDLFSKLFIGSLLAAFTPLFFLTGFLLLGYQVRIIQSVLAERDDRLPEFDQIGLDFGRGSQMFFGTLLYYLPAFILAGLGTWLLASALSGTPLIQMVLYRNYPTLDRARLGMIVLCFSLALGWLILSAPLVMAAVGRFAETGEFSAFLDVLTLADVVWEHKGAAASLMFNLFVLAVLMQVASTVVSAVICFAGAFFQFLHIVAAAHLNGQWAAYLRAHRAPRNIIRPLKPRSHS